MEQETKKKVSEIDPSPHGEAHNAGIPHQDLYAESRPLQAGLPISLSGLEDHRCAVSQKTKKRSVSKFSDKGGGGANVCSFVGVRGMHDTYVRTLRECTDVLRKIRVEARVTTGVRLVGAGSTPYENQKAKVTTQK